MIVDPESRAWRRPPVDAQQRRADIAVAAALFVAAVLSMVLTRAIGLFDEMASPALSIGLLAVLTLPLAVRRIAPVPVLAVVSVTFIVVGELKVPELTVINIALFMAIYSVGAWDPNRRRAMIARVAVVSAMGVWLLLSFFRASTQEIAFDGPGFGVLTPIAAFMLQQVLINVLYFAGAWWFGDHAMASARQRALTEFRTQEVARERATVARQAVTIERLRIARELHDAVAHHVSLMGVQAGAARAVLDHDPATARDQLEALEASSRAAVSELYQLLGTLRDEEHTEGSSPVTATLGLDALPGLLDDAAAGGLRVSFDETGPRSALPPLVSLNLYRVAQEALTNTLKHAGPHARVHVQLRNTVEGIELEIADDGRGRPGPRSTGGGLGLRGMQERAASMGARFESAARVGSGWVVRIAVPLPTGQAVRS